MSKKLTDEELDNYTLLQRCWGDFAQISQGETFNFGALLSHIDALNEELKNARHTAHTNLCCTVKIAEEKREVETERDLYRSQLADIKVRVEHMDYLRRQKALDWHGEIGMLRTIEKLLELLRAR